MIVTLPKEMCPCALVNEDDFDLRSKFFRIALNPISGWYGVFADHLEEALDILGAWADDHAKGLIVDASQMSDEDLEHASHHYVNGAPDCALDLSECMRDMVEEYTLELNFKAVK